MKKFKLLISTILLFLALISTLPVLADEPSVKKSKNGICHAKDTTYYKRTKNYTAYNSMDACLKSGGRKPKR